MPVPVFPPSNLVVFFMLNDLRREVIVRFVDIGVIFDYHCFNIPFITIIFKKLNLLPVHLRYLPTEYIYCVF